MKRGFQHAQLREALRTLPQQHSVVLSGFNIIGIPTDAALPSLLYSKFERRWQTHQPLIRQLITPL